MANDNGKRNEDELNAILGTAFDKPRPGQESGKSDALVDEMVGKPWDDDVQEKWLAASAADSQVTFELLDLLQSLEGWVSNQAIAVRSKPARDFLYEIQDWIDKKHEEGIE